MIPAEAIEAGWEQARADADGYPYPEREDIRRILEAAAPYMLAAAWVDGFTACAYEHMAQDKDPTRPITRISPYRKRQAS